MADTDAATPASTPPVIEPVPDWSITISHPHVFGRLSIAPSREGLPGDAAAPLQFGLHLTTQHPILQDLLKAIGPLVAQLLPIILASLLAKNGGATPPPATS